MKQTVKKLLFMLGIMCLTIFGKETSTTVLADNLDEIENYNDLRRTRLGRRLCLSEI